MYSARLTPATFDAGIGEANTHKGANMTAPLLLATPFIDLGLKEFVEMTLPSFIC